MRISVAMCTYNGERFLAEQLDSIASQTLTPFELVVCDDGSQDRTSEILRSFSARAGFPVHIFPNARNLGSTANFSQSIARCHGDLIALSDQDDLWSPDKLAKIARVFEEQPDVACVFSNAALMDDASQRTGEDAWTRFLFTPELQARMGAGDAIAVLLRLPVATGATMVFRSELQQYLGEIPQDWVHDAWIAWMAALTGRLYPLNEPLVQYRIHTGQQLGLSRESGRQRLRRLGLQGWLAKEKETFRRRYLHSSATYAELATFAELHKLGDARTRRALQEKADLGRRAATLLDAPRLPRLIGMLSSADGFRRFTPHAWKSILRGAVL